MGFRKFVNVLILALLTCLPAMAAPIQAHDINGISHTFPNVSNKATVLFFIAHDCPISNEYAPEFNRIASHYAAHHISFTAVYTENRASPAQVRKHAQDYGYTCPLFLDNTETIAHHFGATVTPTVAIVGPDGTVCYLGSVDNLYAGIGRKRTVVTQHYLRDALDSILSSRPIALSHTPAYGCYITR